MLPRQHLRRIMHALRIQRAERPAYLTSLNARTHGVVIDYVTVAPVGCGKPGVEIADTIPGPMHRNIFR